MFNNKPKTGEELSKQQNSSLNEAATKHIYDLKKEESHRTTFRRERDRILYTGGFRRLQDKTQVLAAYQGGDHRTRLTHTLEVEQIAVSIADALGLNRDLVSAIAIGHDVGHTPFGHAAEAELNKLLKDEGGFSHAVQSVRYLCDGKSDNLKYDKEILEGILKHDTDVYAGGYNSKQFNCEDLNPKEAPSLEAQVVYWADKIAYISHDFEDFYQNEIYYNMRKCFEEKAFNATNVDNQLQYLLDRIMPYMGNLALFETRHLIREILKSLTNKSAENINSYINNKKDKKLDSSIREATKHRINQYEVELINKYTKELDIYIQEINSCKDIEEIIYIEKSNFDKKSKDDYKLKQEDLKKDKKDLANNKNDIEQIIMNKSNKEQLKKPYSQRLSCIIDHFQMELYNDKFNDFIQAKNNMTINEDLCENFDRALSNIVLIEGKFKKEELNLDVDNYKKFISKVKLIFDKIKDSGIHDYISIIDNSTLETDNKKEEKILSDFIKKKIHSIQKEAFVNSLIINFDDDFRKYYLNLRGFLDKHYIFSPEVQRSDAYAKKVVASLFNLFLDNYKLLPLNIQHKINENNSKARVIADYIASMSDRYAVEVYNNLNFAGNRYKL
ncbi:MAG: HD domain-containing protein [Bacteroidales bacterium]